MKKIDHMHVKNLKLRKLRESSNITQLEMANYLQMSRGSYQYLETKGVITGDVLFKLCRFFNVSAGDILEAEPNTSEESTPHFQRLHQSDAKNITHRILSEDEKILLQYYDSLSNEDKMLVQGYIAGLATKSN